MTGPTSPPLMPSTRARERGVALLAALLFAVTILALSSSVIISGVSLTNQKRRTVAAQRAQDAAESGVHHLLATLSGPEGAAVRAAGRLAADLQGTEGSSQAVRYEVTLAPAGNDGSDNDLDGQVDEADEADMLEITSTGHADRVARTVRVTFLSRFRSQRLSAAVAFNLQDATLQLDNSTLLFSGRDVDLNGVETGVVVPGIGIADSSNQIRNSIQSHFRDSIVGLGRNPSVVQVEPLADIEQMIEDAVRSHDIRLDKNGYSPTPLPYGTLDHPKIVFARGDKSGDLIDLNHNKIKGAGILVIDGGLEIGDVEAAVDWKGLVIIRGKFLVDDGYLKIVGGLIVNQQIEQFLDQQQHSQIDDATVTVQYSEQTLSKAAGAVSDGITILNWREGPVPEDAAP